MPGDNILTHQIIGAPVGSEIVLNKVLLVGTKTWTAIGSPLLQQAKVHVVVEEQTKTEHMTVFKRKRRKNYRRNRGVALPVTNLRITDIAFEYNKNEVQSTLSKHVEPIAVSVDQGIPQPAQKAAPAAAAGGKPAAKKPTAKAATA
eukprot:TRINITY_DN3668_c0_g1_i1.p1 TRINITY_DN3668_c0_g1~~TRINITY_DN3668_c0_g1_i1.p1  ORF type:complete len:146 (-),score=46.03 TRINITY_DN3668_c0_g1_i1:54-491(-)